MEHEVEQLRILVGDLFSRIESLEDRVGSLEDSAVAQPKGPEPILTCVQCLAEYKESENGEGYCKYHNGSIKYNFNAQLSCCNQSAQSEDGLLKYPGCTKGKHRSKHHTEFFYTNYLIFMRSLTKTAKEKWLEMDVYDYIKEACLWAEIGKTTEGDVFVVAGSSFAPEVCASLKPREVKKYKKSLVLFEKSDSAGWCLKAELVASGSTVEGVLVTLKTAWSKVPFAKKISFTCEGDDISFAGVECLSDPRPEKSSVNYTVPEETCTGPVLEPGEDYSQGRKNDYPTVTNDDLFAMDMVQLGGTEVDSNTWGMGDGKWTNFFVATIKVVNESMDIVSVAEVLGEYQNADGEWVKCDEVFVRPKEDKNWLEVRDFLVDATAPTTLIVRLDIKITDRAPGNNQESRRAHHSLPQPLLLRITLVDIQKRTASLIIEQGNKPLPLATMETRQASWAKKMSLLFYLSADDVELRKRSDVAIYYNEDRIMLYRPAPNDSGSTYFYLRDDTLEAAAYKAKKSGEKEQELKQLTSENKGCKIQTFAVVDLEYQFTYALKTVISTPTSGATGYFLLPQCDVYNTSLSVTSEEVEVNDEVTVEWNASSVSKNDRIAIFKQLGCDYVSSQYNRQELTEGSIKMKAPGSPGVYEIRYYPSSLQSSHTALMHSVSVAMAQFSVVTA